MNAVLVLGHFCEVHGPCVMLCTKKYDSLPESSQQIFSCCDSCKSLRKEEALTSRRDNHYFITTRNPIEHEQATILKHFMFCSLSSEQEETFYFGDNHRGHVLSHCFTIHDSLARGFLRKYAILYYMKDKLQLLNMSMDILKQIRLVASEILAYSADINKYEQSEESQKVLRQSQETPSNIGRSLADLTGQPNIYQQLHVRFSILLQDQYKVIKLSNYVKIDCPKPVTSVIKELFCKMDYNDFHTLLYYTLIGYEIETTHNELKMGFYSLLPDEGWIKVNKIAVSLDYNKYLITVDPDTIISASTLQNEIESSLKNEKIGERALEEHLAALILHWYNVAQALCWCPKIDANLLKSFNVTKNDANLLIHWTSQCSKDGDKSNAIATALRQILDKF